MYVYIEFNSRKVSVQNRLYECAMKKMFEVEPSQGHKPRIPQIPQREHRRERPTKVGPHFAQETTHPHSPPHHRPKKRSRNPPPTLAPRIRSPYCHVIITAHQILPLPTVLSHPRTRSNFSRQIATALSSLGTLCAHDVIVYPCELVPNHVRLGPLAPVLPG